MSVQDIVETVAATAPDIRAGLPGRRVYDEAENPSGERQLAADVYADELLEERLLALDSVAAYASEERESIVESESRSDSERSSGGEPRDGGEYHVACDPLDGSSNLKSNNAMGTILAVYDEPLPTTGRNLVASAYVLFGPITTMMVARDDTVTEYVLKPDNEGVEMQAVDEDVTLPEDPTVYGFGGRVPDWTEGFTTYAREIERELKLRYGGAMIGDVNQVMTYGGVFAYPALESRPNGKLRLLFEGNPIANIVETAGGASSDGTQSLLDVEAEALHQRTPVHVGNADLVRRLESTLTE